MATHAHTPGAQTRAPSIPSHVPLQDAATPAIPSTDPLEIASELLEALGGSLGVLAAFLEGVENLGSDAPLAVYAAGHTIERVRQIVSTATLELMAFANSQEGR